MACIINAPVGEAKGCVVFTTPERDNVIFKSEQMRAAVEHLKERYVVGLHHNWHDYEFRYDPLFDFSMAGDGDLVERDGAPFKRIPMDACNFSPDAFLKPRSETPFWDILYVARAVAFKGLPDFFTAIRNLYDNGQAYRVLLICSVPPKLELPGIPNLRSHFETMFSPAERKLFTFMTLDWDYPFPFDLETLGFFYRNSRVFLHPAPEERRCRVAAYAWANRMPVVANIHVASILPAEFRKPPFLYEFSEPGGIAAAASLALQAHESIDADWSDIADEFSAPSAAKRLEGHLRELTRHGQPLLISPRPINFRGLDIRLGRHHRLAVGGNRLDYSVDDLCRYLNAIPDDVLDQLMQTEDPEIALGQWGTAANLQSETMADYPLLRAGAASPASGFTGETKSERNSDQNSLRSTAWVSKLKRKFRWVC